MLRDRTSFGMQRSGESSFLFRGVKSPPTAKWPLLPDTRFITARWRGFFELRPPVHFRGSEWSDREARSSFILNRQRNSAYVSKWRA